MEISDIDVSLSQGQLFRKKHFFALYVGIFVSCLLPVLTIVLICLPEVEWDRQLVGTVLICNVFSLALLSLFIFIKRKDSRAKEKVAIWLEDAVELKAYSVGLGLRQNGTKIKVDFLFDGKHCYKESTAKVFGGYDGYVNCFNKYVNRELKILYSPKYDEVVIPIGQV